MTNSFKAVPNLKARSKELAELQDMYRRALAASWAAQPGELQADECIEDIFAGGDGMGHTERAAETSKRKSLISQARSYEQQGTRKYRIESASGYFHGSSKSNDMASHIASSDPQNGAEGNGKQFAVDEIDCRDDLSSWVISNKSYE